MVLWDSMKLILVFACLGLVACDDGDPPAGADAGPPAADAAPVDCAELTYANFGEQFVADYCLSCHSASAGNRQGAPSSVNFDDYQSVLDRSSRFRSRAGSGSSMPPFTFSSKPTEEERMKLVQWVDCGTPE